MSEPEEPAVITCAECGREVDEQTAETEGWGYWSDGVGKLHPFCPACARSEFWHGGGPLRQT